MKLMLVIPHVSDGGGEKVLSELSSGIGTDDVVVVVFEEKFSHPFKGRLISLNLPIDRKSFLSRARGFIGRVLLFRRILQQERPDAVVSFMGEANLINALLSARPIVTVHNHLSTTSKMRGGLQAFASEMLIRMLYRRATVVAVSEAVKQDLVDKFGVPERQVVVIPNSVDSRQIREMAAETVACPWDSGLPVIITAGRLTKEKGQWHLIRAFAEVRKKLPCQLAILGAGELESYLKLLAAELGIGKDVYFLGWQSNPFKFMARANLFVLPSLTEGFGLALVEAMACGLPVISTDCPGGSKEIIAPPSGGEYGVLVPAFDDKMYSGRDPTTSAEVLLAETMLGLLQNSEMRKRYVNAGLSRINDFDRAIFLQSYQRLLALR
jgi:glycosyltransferase involved in cell wall biosynthesis